MYAIITKSRQLDNNGPGTQSLYPMHYLSEFIDLCRIHQ